MLVRADSPIRTPADLNGKTLAVFGLNDIFTVSNQLWIDRNGGDSTARQAGRTSGECDRRRHRRGRIDGGQINEPELAAALATRKFRVLGHPFDAVARRFMYTAWFTTLEYASAHRAAVDGFARAMREAAAYANKNRAETVELLASISGVEAGVIRQMTRAEQGTALDPQLIQPVVDATARYKGIPAVFDARELIDPAQKRDK